MIEIELNIAAPPKKVWDLLTQEAYLRTWWGEDVSFEKRRGGKFTGHWGGSHNQTHGVVTNMEESALLQMSWQDDGWLDSTRVEFILMPNAIGTHLCLQHSGWGIFSNDQRPDLVNAYRVAWQKTLEKLKDVCTQQQG